ncbi:MAG: lysophospholipid acyltransferase family protein [Myxococcota bacterium]|nr:lysophospholipid acyltransferase family protein [Myxococcota bacterium]
MWFRTRIRRNQRLERKGGYIVVANHTSMLDPVWVGMVQRRQVRFMASAALFQKSPLSNLVRALGAFPKKKFVKDKASVLSLVEMYESGQVVALFPEGYRTWDGRTQPVRPGIGRLIHRLEARVVVVRILTGHLQRPRWAKRFRWVPLIVEVDDPVTFSGLSPEEIEGEINQRIQIDPEPEGLGRLLFGWKMAEGLPQYLWACPGCMVLEGLIVDKRDRNKVRCTDCGKAWKVDVRCHLKGVEGGAQDTRVSTAMDDIHEFYINRPVADPDRFALDGVVLEGADVCVKRLGRNSDGPPILAHGLGRLYADRLVVTDRASGEDWTLPLSELDVVNMELGNRLHLRTDGSVLDLFATNESPIKWARFIEFYRRAC